jgi:hypothetical protein
MKSHYGQKYSNREWVSEAVVNESFFEDFETLRSGKKSSPCGGGERDAIAD